MASNLTPEELLNLARGARNASHYRSSIEALEEKKRAGGKPIRMSHGKFNPVAERNLLNRQSVDTFKKPGVFSIMDNTTGFHTRHDKPLGPKMNFARWSTRAMNAVGERAYANPVGFMAYGMGKAAKHTFNAANMGSKLLTGATLPQLALGAGIVGGAILGVEDLLDRNPVEDAKSAGRAARDFHRMMKTAMGSRSDYASTSFQQSTQGLMFGLNSRRTA